MKSYKATANIALLFYGASLSRTQQSINCLWIAQFSSVTQSCPTLCNAMNHSMPGLPVHHQLLEFTHTHVHVVGDAILPSHPLSSLLLLPTIPPSIRASESFPMNQLFASGGQSYGVSALASVLPMNTQD